MILFIGVCVFAYSFFPATVSTPYTTWVNKTHDNVLKGGTVTAFYDYYIGYSSFNQGDQIAILASTQDGTLAAQVIDSSTNNTITSKDNVANVNMDVTIPSSGYYEIKVSRYRTSIYVLFLTHATAYVNVTTYTTEQVPTQAYENVTTYPHKDLQIVGIGIMIAGIGVGVLTIGHDKRKNQNSAPASQDTPSVHLI